MESLFQNKTPISKLNLSRLGEHWVTGVGKRLYEPLVVDEHKETQVLGLER